MQNVTLQTAGLNLASPVADFCPSSPGAESRPSQQALRSLDTLHACSNDFSQSQQLVSREAELHTEILQLLKQTLKTFYYSFKTVKHLSNAKQACLSKLAHYTKFQGSMILYKHMDGSQSTNLRSAYQRSQLCGTGMFQIHLDTSSTVLRITSQSLKHYLTIVITAYSFEQV